MAIKTRRNETAHEATEAINITAVEGTETAVVELLPPAEAGEPAGELVAAGEQPTGDAVTGIGVEDFAALVGSTVLRVNTLRRQGGITSVVQSGRAILYLPAAADEFSAAATASTGKRGRKAGSTNASAAKVATKAGKGAKSASVSAGDAIAASIAGVVDKATNQAKRDVINATIAFLQAMKTDIK